MMLHWLQQTGNKPIALMGGGTTRVGDPSGRDETRKILTYEQIDANKESIKGTFAKFMQLRRGQDRRRDGRQRRVADQAQLHRDAARRRPAFLDQPHADDGFGEAAARARAGALVHRIQLHDPAVLRFRRAGAPLRLQSADGRLGPVGQHRQRHRSRPPHGHASALRADLPAADHVVRRQDGQDRGRRRLAQCRHAAALRLLAVLAQHRGRRRRALPASCSRRCRWTRSRGSRRCKGQEINEAKKVLATEATALLHGRAAAEQAAETARTTFEEGATRRRPADGRDCRAPNSTPASACSARSSRSRARRLERRGAASDQGRRAAASTTRP